MTTNTLESINIQCPYCWETIDILIDCSVDSQEYIEDCQVCCRPIQFDILVDEDGLPSVTARSDDD